MTIPNSTIAIEISKVLYVFLLERAEKEGLSIGDYLEISAIRS